MEFSSTVVIGLLALIATIDLAQFGYVLIHNRKIARLNTQMEYIDKYRDESASDS